MCTDDVFVLNFFHCCAAAYVRPACPCRRWIRFTLILVRLQCHQHDYCVSRPICLLQSMFTKSMNMSWLPSIAFVQKNEPRKHLFSGWASCTKSSNCSPNCKGWSRRVKENNSNLTVEISLHVHICWPFVGSQNRSKYDFIQYMMVKHFVVVYHWCRYFLLESKFEPVELQSSSKLGQETLPWSWSSFLLKCALNAELWFISKA